MWSRKSILSATLTNSAVNFLLPFIVFDILGGKTLAVWMAVRAGTQLVLAAIPNPLNGLLYIRPSVMSGLVLCQFIKAASISLALVLIGICFWGYNWGGGYNIFGIVVYVFFFVLSGYASIWARVVRRSDLIFYVAILDAVISAFLFLGFVFISEFQDFDYLLFSFSIKELLKTVVVVRFGGFLRAGKVFGESRHAFIANIYSIKHVSRSFIQVYFQHGDRMLLPVVFSAALAGEAMLGSSLAMLTTMIASSAFAWALPFVVEGGNKSQYAVRQWRVIMVLVGSAFVFLNFFMSLLNDLLSGVFESLLISKLMLYTFVFVSINGFFVLSFLLDYNRIRRPFFSFSCLFLSLLCWLFVWVCMNVFDFGGLVSLAVGISFSLFIFVLVNFQYISRIDWMLSLLLVSLSWGFCD